ncbi:MAG: tRNA 5'-guanylyltransferase [Candidatus Nezhaarchaeota archaeon]|nr:tRNA 5'-guanylyltransferase [Candidatus Nezhaarchaeota archaeon]
MPPLDFKQGELFASVRVPPGLFFVIRCDGRGFRKLCEKVGFAKPFDEGFARLMVQAAKAVYGGGFNPLFTYIQSDEASFLFNGESSFGRRVEKLVSIMPSLMSSRMAVELERKLGYWIPVAFDARVVLLSRDSIVEYMAWRQMEAWRNHLNSYAYYALLSKGASPREASTKLKGLKARDLHEIVFREAGINLASTPAWQRRGVALTWAREVVRGFNPIKGMEEEALRIRLREVWELPLFNTEEGRRLVESSIEARMELRLYQGPEGPIAIEGVNEPLSE